MELLAGLGVLGNIGGSFCSSFRRAAKHLVECGRKGVGERSLSQGRPSTPRWCCIDIEDWVRGKGSFWSSTGCNGPVEVEPSRSFPAEISAGG